jgi:hypothetical protein
LAIDRIDRTVGILAIHDDAGVSPERVDRRQGAFAVASTLARVAVMVVLASLAILVLLPAALASQAASAF